MKYKLLIFDFDGTLADTRKTIVLSKQETMRRMNIEVMDDETCSCTIGLSSELAFASTHPYLTKEQIDECVRVYREIFEKMKDEVPPEIFPGVVETLDELEKRGYLLTVASARNRQSLIGFLEKMNLMHYFPYILGENDTKRLKPFPDAVLKTMEDLKYVPEETLVIGDMPYDVEMGKNAKADACGVTYGNSNRENLVKSGADYVIDDMRELLEICK